jgi:hypothetical protein
LNITSRSTKAEILAAYTDLQQQAQQGATWQQVWRRLQTTWQAVSRETPLLIKDCYNAGSTARQWISGIVDELSHPVLH